MKRGHRVTTNVASLPVVDWNDLRCGRKARFLSDLRAALSEIGFVVLCNHPDFSDDKQRRDFKCVRKFFEAPDDVKRTCDISMTPYFRGWSRAGRVRRRVDGINEKLPPLLAQEAFQYGFERPPLARYDDQSVPIHKRLFRGPNTWPSSKALPEFRPCVESLTRRYHKLTHDLGHLIMDCLGVEKSHFDRYFPKHDPDLAASLNCNFGISAIAPHLRERVQKEFDEKIHSPVTSAHIDGPPFIALLINDRPGLQVIAKEGKWVNAPVTCRTSPGEYGDVPVVPGSVVINVGGSLMHLSRGRLVATLHRVNPFLIPEGETRISMPYFLIPRSEGALIPFVDESDHDTSATGYSVDRDRGVNAALNRMATFPQCTRRWWREEFKRLRKKHLEEVERETRSAYGLARKRAIRTGSQKASL